MNKHTAQNLGIITALTMPTVLSFAETVVLKNGSVIKGSIVEMNETDATLDTADMGRMVIKRRSIEKIADGIEIAPSVPAVQTSASVTPVVVNNNNNNNNNNFQTVEADSNPVVENAKVADSVEEGRWSSRIGAGYGFFSGRSNFNLSAEGLALHIVPFRVRLLGGFFAEATASGMLEQRHNDSDGVQFWQAGAGLGWSSAAPARGSSGGIWTVNVSYGRGQVTAKANGAIEEDQPLLQESSDYPVGYPYPFYEEDGTGPNANEKYVYSGPVAGVGLSYTYSGTGGWGATLGANGFWGDLKKVSGPKFYQDFYQELEPRSMSTSVLVAYAGLEKRF